MKNPLKLTACALALVLGASSVFAANPLISLPIRDLKWQDVPGSAGKVSYANTEGDLLSNGAGFYSAFVKFKAGTDNGLHTHSHALPTVVMAGTFYAVIDGKRIEYPAGSYYNLPAKQVHESGCTAGEDCLLFQYQENNFDLVPVNK